MEHLSFANEALTLQRSLHITSMAVGLVFGYAVVSKLSDVPGLIAGIRDYRHIPGWMAPSAAGILIVSEILIAIAHLAGVGLQLVAPGTIGLLSIFFATMASLLKRGEKRPCLCFGAHQDEPVNVSSLARISILWLAEVALYWRLIIDDDPIASGTGSVYGHIESLLLAILVVTLAGWCLSVPRFRRAWDIVRS